MQRVRQPVLALIVASSLLPALATSLTLRTPPAITTGDGAVLTGRLSSAIGPISGKKQTDAAAEAGFAASTKPTLLIEGDDRPGLGFEIAKAIADLGVSISFDVTQVIAKKYSGVYGFQSEEFARKAAEAIKKVAR